MGCSNGVVASFKVACSVKIHVSEDIRGELRIAEEVGHTTTLGIPTGTCKSSSGKPVKNLNLEESGPMDPSPGQIQVIPLKI